ncbi:hypothetical protein Pmani_036265 [Petrolisthes manimaculis]|uniref:Peptidase S1 domain-containing protein n=1 Tax=Petrolisthes manimaculis TaxID=1843537 RepID=A0AAE1NLD8_9EUCA|nr:hypothetical protein Pmani_036265 [Petrolisthes manimaculis]
MNVKVSIRVTERENEEQETEVTENGEHEILEATTVDPENSEHEILEATTVDPENSEHEILEATTVDPENSEHEILEATTVDPENGGHEILEATTVDPGSTDSEMTESTAAELRTTEWYEDLGITELATTESIIMTTEWPAEVEGTPEQDKQEQGTTEREPENQITTEQGTAVDETTTEQLLEERQSTDEFASTEQGTTTELQQQRREEEGEREQELLEAEGDLTKQTEKDKNKQKDDDDEEEEVEQQQANTTEMDPASHQPLHPNNTEEEADEMKEGEQNDSENEGIHGKEEQTDVELQQDTNAASYPPQPLTPTTNNTTFSPTTTNTTFAPTSTTTTTTTNTTSPTNTHITFTSTNPTTTTPTTFAPTTTTPTPTTLAPVYLSEKEEDEGGKEDNTSSMDTKEEPTEEDLWALVKLCGQDGRIVGGDEAGMGAWPWAAIIRDRYGGLRCGGTLISWRHVLTAAHCIADPEILPYYPLTVTLGEHDTTNTTSTQTQTILVSQALYHNHYGPQHTFRHDVGLLVLSASARNTPNVGLACLPHPDHVLSEGSRVTVVGWGATEEGGDFSPRLREVELITLQPSICNAVYPNDFTRTTMICAGEPMGGRDSCQSLLVLSLVAVALAVPTQAPYGHSDPQGPAKYDFNYAVRDDASANDFGHNEARDGYDTQGSYYVQLPDGRLQQVTYYVNGDSGYVAEVSYQGEATYPAHGGYQ